MALTIMATNDDGVFAPGLREAVAAMCRIPGASVYVVGPAEQWSAKGHAITIDRPLYAERLPDSVFDTPAWEVSGSPADCVKLGLNHLIPSGETVDVVVSGINSGPNLATDVLYSGTVAAAIEAQLEGVPGVAVSLGSFSEERDSYRTAAAFTKCLLDVLSDCEGEPCLLNVNVPAIPAEEIQGVSLTELGPCPYRHWIKVEEDDAAGRRYWLKAEMIRDAAPEGSDLAAVASDCISITPLEFFDITDRSRREVLKPLLGRVEESFCR